MTYRYILVLGSNCADRGAYLKQAIRLLENNRLKILRSTAVLKTAPILVRNQQSFLNQGLLVATDHRPDELLGVTRLCEQQAGRRQRIRYGPREIDIDIVWWSEGSYTSSELTIPHKYNRARHWVRRFMAELLPQEVDNETGVQYMSMGVKPIQRVQHFLAKKQAGEKIAMVTCYDYTFARLLGRTSVDCVLVGDSLGNVIQGERNTLPVTLEDIIYHARAVRRALPDAFIIGDLPFLSYQTGVAGAIASAGQLIKEAHCDAVKLEGGMYFLETVQALNECGIPVMGHLGLTPQWVLRFGGHRLQAKTREAAQRLLTEAQALENAGCFALVLEMVPASVAAQCSKQLTIPVIGIGAGAGTDGQVLVLSDLLGLDPDFKPRFVRHFARLSEQVIAAVEQYSAAVREGSFPSPEESFQNPVE